MKITVWGINYDPEPTGIGPFNTDLCDYFAEHGHEVTMLTSFPYYPWWKKRPEDAGKLYETGIRRGVKVIRCWHFVPSRPSTLTRLMHELSFVATSSLRALFSPRPDVCIVVSPPLFLGFGATMMRWLRWTKVVYHVQDLQPDAALGLGMIKPGLAVKALYLLEKWNYRRSSLVTGISQGMMNAFKSKGINPSKTYLFPNWIPDGDVSELPPPSVSFRAANQIDAETSLIAYSGNLGVKQGLDIIVEAARVEESGAEAGHRRVHWAVCGEGAAKASLEKKIADENCRSVRLYPLQSDEYYQSLLREADVCLITQQKGTGQFFFPSKLLSILQLGRAVLAVADESSELAHAVKEGDFGLVVAPGDAAALATAVRTMVTSPREQQDRWANNGLVWVDQFRRSRVLGAFDENLKELVGGAPRRS